MTKKKEFFKELQQRDELDFLNDNFVETPDPFNDSYGDE